MTCSLSRRRIYSCPKSGLSIHELICELTDVKNLNFNVRAKKEKSFSINGTTYFKKETDCKGAMRSNSDVIDLTKLEECSDVVEGIEIE